MALFTCVWIIILAIFLYIMAKLPNTLPINLVCLIILIAWIMFRGFVVHYINVVSKPIKTEKATVTATKSYGSSSSTIKYYGLKFKAEDGNEFAVIVPYEVYKALEKGDQVLVKHQGTELIDIKKIIYKSSK